MMKRSGAQELAQQIEELVQSFIAETRVAAVSAVERAFSVAKVESSRASRRTGRNASPRRSRAAVEALAERLYEAVCARPGQGMNVLAPMVGATGRALQVPAARLKKSGRIRSVGHRRLARYFPMVKQTSKSV